MSPKEFPVTDLIDEMVVPEADPEFWKRLEARFAEELPSPALSVSDGPLGQDVAPSGSELARHGHAATGLDPDLSTVDNALIPTRSRRSMAAAAVVLVVVALGVAMLLRDDPRTTTVPAVNSTTRPEVASTTTPATTTPATTMPATTTPASEETPPTTTTTIRTMDVSLLDDPSSGAVPTAETIREMLEELPWANPEDAHQDPVSAVQGYLGYLDTLFSQDFDATVVEPDISPRGNTQSIEVQLPAYTNEPFETPTITVNAYRSSIDQTWWVLGSASSTFTIRSPVPGHVVQNQADGSFPLSLEHHHPPGLGDLIEWVFLPHDGGEPFRTTFADAPHPPPEFEVPADGYSVSSGGYQLDGTWLYEMTCYSQCSVGAPNTGGTLIVLSPRAATTIPIYFLDADQEAQDGTFVLSPLIGSIDPVGGLGDE